MDLDRDRVGDLDQRAAAELAAFRDDYYGGYSEGDPLDPMTPSGFLDGGYLSILHATYLVCIRPWVGPGTRVLEIGPGRGSWTRCFVARGAHGIDCVDAMSAERNRFWEHVGRHPQVRYHVTTDFSLDVVADASFDYFFSFGVFCHISPPLIERYLRSLHRKLVPGAHGFMLIADYDQYNRFVQGGERFGLKRAVKDCFPGPAEAAVRDDQRSHFLPRYLRAKDEDGAIDPNRWYHLGAPACQTMLEAIGFEVVDLDVGSVPRDPIVHFRRP
jgi:hypothetical protein